MYPLDYNFFNARDGRRCDEGFPCHLTLCPDKVRSRFRDFVVWGTEPLSPIERLTGVLRLVMRKRLTVEMVSWRLIHNTYKGKMSSGCPWTSTIGQSPKILGPIWVFFIRLETLMTWGRLEVSKWGRKCLRSFYKETEFLHIQVCKGPKIFPSKKKTILSYRQRDTSNYHVTLKDLTWYKVLIDSCTCEYLALVLDSCTFESTTVPSSTSPSHSRQRVIDRPPCVDWFVRASDGAKCRTVPESTGMKKKRGMSSESSLRPGQGILDNCQRFQGGEVGRQGPSSSTSKQGCLWR